MSAKNSTIGPLVSQINLQTRLFNNALEDFKPSDENKRINDSLNHLSWQAGHIAFARYLLSGAIGIPDANPYQELYAGFKPLNSSVKYPSVKEAKEKFDDITAKINDRLSSITEEELSGVLPYGSPIGDNTVRGMMAFLSHHEAFHLGQIATIRRYLGLSPMSYK